MGPREGVETFTPDDSFLRRIDRKRHALDGIVAADVFRPRPNETTLSFTYQDALLRQGGALAAYQRAKRLPSGDLPGICRLTFHDLTSKLDPPLPPRPEQDETDPAYGHLHCVTDCPVDEIHREKMAKLATENLLLMSFVRGK